MVADPNAVWRGSCKVAGRLRNASLRWARVNDVLGERIAGRLLDEGVSEDWILWIHNRADGGEIQPAVSYGDTEGRPRGRHGLTRELG